MTRLADNNASQNRQLPNQQLQTNQLQTGQPNAPARNVPNQPVLEAHSPAQTLSPSDRLTHGREPTQNVPNNVAKGLPTDGEPEGTLEDRGLGHVGETWATVFGHQQEGEATNRLMHDILVLQQTRNQNERGLGEEAHGTGTGGRGIGGAGLSSLPQGAVAVNGDGSVTTPGGFTIFNDGGHNWRIATPSGEQHRIWGDPHVDENNDGKNDWHFNRDASFVLPDGTKIFVNTTKVSELGGGAVTVSDQLHIQYGASVAGMDVRNGGPATMQADGATFDHRNADGQIFVLGNEGHFLDSRTLGRLYDAGKDFKADVNMTERGTITESARFTLSHSQQTGLHLNTKDLQTERAGLQKVPTLSEMVQTVYTNTTTRKPGEAEDTDDPGLKKPHLQVRGVTGG